MRSSTLCCASSTSVTLDAMVPQKEIGGVYDRIAPLYDIWGKPTESRARMRASSLPG